MELWELSARERIRDSLARYSWSGDALRVHELVLAFCDDGVLEVRGEAPVEGRDAIAAFIGGVGATADARSTGPRIVRHNVTNIRFLALTPEEARVESYF